MERLQFKDVVNLGKNSRKFAVLVSGIPLLSLRKFDSGSHLFHGGANRDGSLDKDGPTICGKHLPESLVSRSVPSNLLEVSFVPAELDEWPIIRAVVSGYTLGMDDCRGLRSGV